MNKIVKYSAATLIAAGLFGMSAQRLMPQLATRD